MYAYIIDHFDLDGATGVFERETASAKRFRTKREAVENMAGTGYKATTAAKLPGYFKLRRGDKVNVLTIANLSDRDQLRQYETVRETMASWA